MARTITVSKDLNATRTSPVRFCATAEGDVDPERGGFGRTEIAALAMLIEAFPRSERQQLAGADIERIGVR